jgi:hypothetical protein
MGENMRSRFRVINVATGKIRTDRTVSGFGRILDATRTKAYLSDFDLGTFTLNAKGRNYTRISRKPAGQLSVSNNLMSVWTADPYAGGCNKVVRVDAPRTKVWKSCKERVEAFNTDGTGFATVDLLSDGIGPGTVWTRTLDGTLTARYTTNWFGLITWESPTSLLLEANGNQASALVRCVAQTCENATDTYPVPNIRAAAR